MTVKPSVGIPIELEAAYEKVGDSGYGFVTIPLPQIAALIKVLANDETVSSDVLSIFQTVLDSSNSYTYATVINSDPDYVTDVICNGYNVIENNKEKFVFTDDMNVAVEEFLELCDIIMYDATCQSDTYELSDTYLSEGDIPRPLSFDD